MVTVKYDAQLKDWVFKKAGVVQKLGVFLYNCRKKQSIFCLILLSPLSQGRELKFHLGTTRSKFVRRPSRRGVN